MGKEIRWSFYLNDLSLKIPAQRLAHTMTATPDVDAAAAADRAGALPARRLPGARRGRSDLRWPRHEAQRRCRLAGLAGQAEGLHPALLHRVDGRTDRRRARSSSSRARSPSPRTRCPSATSRRRAADMTATRKWSALAVLLVAAIFAASWFLLIAPKRSEATDLQGADGRAGRANERLVQQLEVLKAQAAGPAQAGGVPRPDPQAAPEQPGPAGADPGPDRLPAKKSGVDARPRSRRLCPCRWSRRRGRSFRRPRPTTESAAPDEAKATLPRCGTRGGRPSGACSTRFRSPSRRRGATSRSSSSSTRSRASSGRSWSPASLKDADDAADVTRRRRPGPRDPGPGLPVTRSRSRCDRRHSTPAPPSPSTAPAAN